MVQSAEDDTQDPESERPSAGTFDGEDFLFHLYRGSELLQDNCVAEAKEELERALSMQPRDIEGQGLLGVVYFRLGLYPRAIQIYEDIIRLCPDEVTPRVNLALCYLKTGQPQLARDALEEVIRRVSGHTRAWGYLGLVFERMGDHAKAMAAFERAGQPQMARRMQQLLEAVDEPARDLNAPEQAELRAVAADAVQELDGEEPPGPFSAVEANEAASAPSRAGRWRATEPGEELVPPPSRPHRPGSLAGRFGPAVPALTPTIPPPGSPGPAETEQPEYSTPVPVSALAAQGLLGAPEGLHVAVRSDGVLLVRIEENFTARVDTVRAIVPAGRALNTAIVRRRARGRELEEPLGGLGAPLVTFEGKGTLVLSVALPRRAIAVQLGEEFLYVREEQLLGFDASVRHENGRLATGAVDAVAMVQLSGRGSVVFEVRQGLRAVEVAPERALTVRAEDVIGWTGRMLAQPLGADQAPGSLPGFLGFSGDGSVLLDLV